MGVYVCICECVYVYGCVCVWCVCMWDPKYKRNEQTQNRNMAIDTENRWLPAGSGVEEKKQIKSFS